MSQSPIETVAEEMAHFIRELIIASDEREAKGHKRIPYAEAHYQKAVAVLKRYERARK